MAQNRNQFKQLDNSDFAMIMGGSKHDYNVWYDVGWTIRHD